MEKKMPKDDGYKLTDEARAQKVEELTKQIVELIEEREKLRRGEG